MSRCVAGDNDRKHSARRSGPAGSGVGASTAALRHHQRKPTSVHHDDDDHHHPTSSATRDGLRYLYFRPVVPSPAAVDPAPARPCRVQLQNGGTGRRLARHQSEARRVGLLCCGADRRRPVRAVQPGWPDFAVPDRAWSQRW